MSRSAEEGDTTKVARASAEDHINDLCLDEEKCWEGMIDLIKSAGAVSKKAKTLDDKLSTQKSSISRLKLEAYTVEVGRILVQRVGKLNQQVKRLKEKAADGESEATVERAGAGRVLRGAPEATDAAGTPVGDRQRVHTTSKNSTLSTAAGPHKRKKSKNSTPSTAAGPRKRKKTAHTQSRGGEEEGEAGGEEEPTAAATTLSFKAVCAAVGTEDSHVLDPQRCLRMPAIAAYHDAGGAYPAEGRSSRQQPLANGFLITCNPFGRNQPQANKDLKAITLIAQTQLILRGVRDAIVPFKHANKDYFIMTDEGRDARREVARTITLERLQRLRGSTPVSPEQVDLVKMQEWFDGDFATIPNSGNIPVFNPSGLRDAQQEALKVFYCDLALATRCPSHAGEAMKSARALADQLEEEPWAGMQDMD